MFLIKNQIFYVLYLIIAEKTAMSTQNFKARSILRSATGFVLDCLFPVDCSICGQPQNQLANPDGWLCFSCGEKIHLFDWLFCPICNRKLVGLEKCQTHPVSLKALGAAASYDSETIKQLIWKYKYGFIESLAKPLGQKLVEYLKIAFLPYLDIKDGSWLVTYIPLHPKRERWRGFNQAKLLAQYVSDELSLPIAPTLNRINFRTPQMEIKEKKNRFTNIKNSFAPTAGLNLKNKNIILIDDIAASGATLIEAAKVLKRAKAKNVYGFVIARSQ
jgi:ComF family protein